MRTIATAEGIAVVGLAELPIPPQNLQIELPPETRTLEEAADASDFDAEPGSEGDAEENEPEDTASE